MVEGIRSPTPAHRSVIKTSEDPRHRTPQYSARFNVAVRPQTAPARNVSNGLAYKRTSTSLPWGRSIIERSSESARERFRRAANEQNREAQVERTKWRRKEKLRNTADTSCGEGDDVAPRMLLKREREAVRRREERELTRQAKEKEELRLSSSFRAIEVRALRMTRGL